MERKKNKTKPFGIFVFYLAIAIIFLVFSVFLYMVGFSNMDTGQNIRYLNAKYDLSLVDTATDFNQYSGEFLFIHGVKYQFYFFLVSMFLMGYIGFLLSEIYNRGKSKEV